MFVHRMGKGSLHGRASFCRIWRPSYKGHAEIFERLVRTGEVRLATTDTKVNYPEVGALIAQAIKHQLRTGGLLGRAHGAAGHSETFDQITRPRWLCAGLCRATACTGTASSASPKPPSRVLSRLSTKFQSPSIRQPRRNAPAWRRSSVRCARFRSGRAIGEGIYI